MPPPKGPEGADLGEQDALDEGDGAGLDVEGAGAGLPAPEPLEAETEEPPLYDEEVPEEGVFEEGVPEEGAPEEAGFGEGPPLLLVNNEGQNILAKEKTRQLINKVNILSKSLEAKLPLYDEGKDLPEPEDEMREICRAREVEINKLEQAKTAAEIARLENEDEEPGTDISIEEEAKKIRQEWPGDEYDDYGGYPMAPDAHYEGGYGYDHGYHGHDHGHDHGHAPEAAYGAPAVGPPATAGCPPPIVALALLLPQLQERRKLRPAGFLSQERLDFAGHTGPEDVSGKRLRSLEGNFGGRVAGDAQVVEGTVSLNGTITPEIVSKLNWAAQNALVEACGHGSKVQASTKLELSPNVHRAVDIKFWVLPRLGGGGDCAMTLVEAAAGGFAPPFPLSGPDKKPLFRNMMQNQLSRIMDTSIMSDMYLRLWRVTCAVKPVWMLGNQLSESNSNMACSTYASGWEVYYAPSLTEPATAEGGSWVPGYSTGNSNNVVGQLTDRCMLANSACFCAALQGCGWRQQADGSTACMTISDGDTGTPVSCGACSNQPECPPQCSSATFACTCAALSISCLWENEECKPAGGGPSNIPCSACVLQDTCQAARPRAVDFAPKTIFALPREGDLSIIEISFNTQLGPLRAARGAVQFICGTAGREPTRTSVTLLEYTVPGEGLEVAGNVLKVASGTVPVAESTSCTLLAGEGVVTNVDGLPSQPIEFGSYMFKMKDSVPPMILSFLPSAGAGGVLTAQKTVSITFNERVRQTESFSAEIRLVDLFGEPLDAPVPIGLDSVNERVVRLDVRGKLQPGRFYEITIAAGSIVDYGNQLFEGLAAGVYKFKTDGNHDDVVIVDALGNTGPSTAVVAGAAGGGMLVLLAVACIAYRTYVVSREPHDLPPSPVEATSNKSPPRIRFDEEALKVQYMDDLPDSPENRKSYKFDDETNEPSNEPSNELRKAAQEAATVRRNSIAAHMELPRIPTGPTNQRRSSYHGNTAKEETNQPHQRGSRVHPPAEHQVDKRPKKEPPKLKTGHYLSSAGAAWS
ncbi:unnamed protein product [Symbiodinium natans]|uniref:SbsA Ig-like domain-containing protein n=1 Tax=Symbiodinium natans TaxID=878477 RepID=A0A812JR32_9DINO|nr:unnamed protein product [Symbiodinium natans]